MSWKNGSACPVGFALPAPMFVFFVMDYSHSVTAEFTTSCVFHVVFSLVVCLGPTRISFLPARLSHQLPGRDPDKTPVISPGFRRLFLGTIKRNSFVDLIDGYSRIIDDCVDVL